MPAFDEERRSFVLLLAQECGRALERARLYAAERSARVQAQFAERQVGFLAVASARLSASLDISRGLAEIADLVVGHLGDFCAIHLVTDGLPARLVTGSMATPNGVRRFGGEDDLYPLDAQSEVGFPAVLRNGRGELLPVIDDAVIERAARNPEQIARLKQLGIVTQLCVPLRARDQTLGCITLASRQAGRRYTYADLVLAEELASRVAQAIDNAALYQAAIAASRAKSSFLAVMSHELRTPLNAILGYSDLMLLGVPSQIGPETRHQVDRIRNAARHLLQMVDDVLNFARIETGKDRVRVGAVNLDGLIRDAVGMVSPAATEKGLMLGYQAITGVVLHTD
jgi:signal transduction histidine kinase